MKERLANGHYTSRAEFEREVRLVFSNAIEYNNEGDEVWTAAQALSETFESLCGALAGISTVVEGGNDDDAQIGRAPTVRKPGKRKSAPLGDTTRMDSPPPAEERKKGRELLGGAASAPRDYTKAVRDGGWKAGALEVTCASASARTAVRVLTRSGSSGCR